MARYSTVPMLEAIICNDDDTRSAVKDAFCGKGGGERHDNLIKMMLTPGHAPLPDLAVEAGCSHAYVYRTWHSVRDYCVGRFIFRSCRQDIFSPLNTTALLLEIVPCLSISDKFERIAKYAGELAEQVGLGFMLGQRERNAEWVAKICANWRPEDRELAEAVLAGHGDEYIACRHACSQKAVGLLRQDLGREMMIQAFWNPFDELVGRADLRTIRVTVKRCASVDERSRAMKENISRFCQSLFTNDYLAGASGVVRSRVRRPKGK